MHTRFNCAALAAAVALLCLPAQATVTSTTSSVSYTGNGATTAYAVPFRFLASTDLVVTVAGVTKTIVTDYTVSGAGGTSGTVTFLVAPANATAVVIRRAVDFTQKLSIRGARLLDTGALENELDKLTMLAQQLVISNAMVSTSASLTGNGSVASPLSLNLANDNTWTGTQTFNAINTAVNGSLVIIPSFSNGATALLAFGGSANVNQDGGNGGDIEGSSAFGTGSPGTGLIVGSGTFGTGTLRGYALKLIQNNTIKAHIYFNGGVLADPSSLTNTDFWVTPTAARYRLNGVTGTVCLTGNGTSTGCETMRAVTGCTTAASVGATCGSIVTWPTAFADTAYTAVCGGDLVTSGVPLNGGLTAKSTASISFQTVAATAAAAKFTTIECIAIHD